MAEAVGKIIDVLTDKLELTKNGDIEHKKLIEDYKNALFTIAKLKAWLGRSRDISDTNFVEANTILTRKLLSIPAFLLELSKLFASGLMGVSLKYFSEGKYKESASMMILATPIFIFAIYKQLFR